MKKKIFPKIIYYLFTFSLGLLLALTLPYYFMYYDVPLNDMQQYLEQGTPDKAMELVGGYFNREAVYEEKFDDGGGIVLFEAATLVYNSGEEGDKTVNESKLQQSYAGFIYGVKDKYAVSGEDNNRTALIVTNAEGQTRNVTLLDYDLDQNKVNEDIGTMVNNGFIYLEFDKGTFGSVAKLTFIDNKGEVFKEIDVSAKLQKNLDYSTAFFTDVNDFIKEYNRDYKSDKLEGLYNEFSAKNDKYGMSSHGDTKKKADRKAAVWIVVYFVVIYIIGDFLVGRHFIWRFFKWLHYKTPWGKKQALKRKENREVFGHDYYSQVTMSLDLEDLPDFSESVQVRYTLGDIELRFILLKENNYVATERTKAGTYVNAWIDINKDYAPTNMPENLVVEGYKMDVKIKIIKRKEESV